MLSYSAKSDLGNQRDNNEDYFLACPELNLWILADGVGGHDAGEVASRLACEVIKSEVAKGENLEHAINSAHQAIKAAPAQGKGSPGMASTIVVLQVHGNEYQISWVGDSRAYLWRDENLQQLSKDQSLVQRLLDEKVITPEEAVNHPRRNLVIQALGQENLDEVEVESINNEFQDGDLILLCSDGLTDYVSDEEITDDFLKHNDLDSLMDQLIAKALSTEGKDNITAMIVNLVAKQINETQSISVEEIEKALPATGLQSTVSILIPALILLGIVWFFL